MSHSYDELPAYGEQAEETQADTGGYSPGEIDLGSTAHVDVSHLLEGLGPAGELDHHTPDPAGDQWVSGADHEPTGGVLHEVAADQLQAPDPSTAASHPVVYPPAVPPEFQENSGDPVVNIYDSIDTGMASDASHIWGLAHPGEAWPYEGATPEQPAQLVEQVVGDSSVPAPVQQTAANWLASHSAQLMTTTEPPADPDRVVTTYDPVTVPATVVTPATETAPTVSESPSIETNTGEAPAAIAPATVTTSPDVDQPAVQHDLQYWFRQHTDYTCAPSSATELINEFTGRHFANEDTVADYARQRGWLSSSSGMDFGELPALLDHFGVPAHEESAGTNSLQALTTLEHAVDDQHKAVVMFVNAADYWYKDDGASEGGAAPHAVRIVDIDQKNGIAILSDTGDPAGKGSEVPLSELLHAWSQEHDGNIDYPLVVTDATDPGYVDAPSPSPSVSPMRPDISPVDFPAPAAPPRQPNPGHGEFREILEWIVLPVAVGAGLAAKSIWR